MFTKFQGVPPGQLEQAIGEFTDADWDHFERGYLDVAVQELRDWWTPMLGLAEGVDVAALFCTLYQRSLTRNSGV